MDKKYLKPQFSTVGLVAYYKLFLGLTTTASVFDYALNGFAGIPFGTDIAPAYPGFAFNGTDDRIDFVSGSVSVKTIIQWVRKDTPGEEGIIDLNGTDYITLDGTTLTLNGFAGGTNVRYVDGVTGSTTVSAEWGMIGVTSTTGRDASAGNMKIGTEASAGTFLKGSIGETMLFDRVLTADEILSIYNITRGRYSA